MEDEIAEIEFMILPFSPSPPQIEPFRAHDAKILEFDNGSPTISPNVLKSLFSLTVPSLIQAVISESLIPAIPPATLAVDELPVTFP